MAYILPKINKLVLLNGKIMRGQIPKMNKDVAGYLMLLILAESDGNFDNREGNVIVEYIKDKFPLGGNLDSATEYMGSVDAADFEESFEAASHAFYASATSEERTDFLRFCMKLVRADNKVDAAENKLITMLFENWDV